MLKKYNVEFWIMSIQANAFFLASILSESLLASFICLIVFVYLSIGALIVYFVGKRDYKKVQVARLLK